MKVPFAAVVALVVIGVTLSSKAKFYWPQQPDVPVTLQTLALHLIAYYFRDSLSGAAGVLLWSLLVFAGAPIGARGRHTRGYIVGFVLAATFSSRAITSFGNELHVRFLCFTIADTVILFCGACWYTLASGKPWQQAVLPFLAGDVVKISVALLITSIWPNHFAVEHLFG